MWGFQNIRNQAIEMFRGKGIRQNQNEGTIKTFSNSAMDNVVTPDSIPQFTLPPMLSYEQSSEDESSNDCKMQKTPGKHDANRNTKTQYTIKKQSFEYDSITENDSSSNQRGINNNSESQWSLRSLVKGGTKKQLEATFSNKSVVKPQTTNGPISPKQGKYLKKLRKCQSIYA